MENNKFDELKISIDEYNSILNLQSEILEMLASRIHYEEILEHLCKLAESLLPNSVASIMLLDKTTGLMSILSAPNIPAIGHEALKNLKPCVGGGSCGNAIFHNEAQFVSNTFTDDRWTDIRQIAYDFNLCSCWSIPIRDEEKVAIGTFALSSFEHRSPSPFHKKLLETAASIVNIVLKNKKDDMRIKLFSKAMDTAIEGMIITDENNNIIEVNQSFSNTYGLKNDDLIGKNPSVLSSKTYSPEFYKEMWSALTHEHYWSGEIVNKDVNGLDIPIWLSISALYDGNKVQNYLAIFSDLRDIKKKERQLLRAEKMSLMGEMIGNIAHQWRQPLSIISTASTGIIMEKEYGILDENSLIKTCNIINDNAQYLSQTIEDFRNFTKDDHNSVQFSLKNDTDSFLKLIDSTIKHSHIQVIISLIEDINIQGYPNELIQCFINIFNNAKDALVDKNQEEDRFVFISQETVDKNVVIKFKDNAGGIAEDVLPRVFEPYFTTKHQSQGTGLGLHMTYNLIVESMNGTIEVNNVHYKFNGKEYDGAEFVITLPLDSNDSSPNYSI